MKSFMALIQREYHEHRGAFFWAPLALVAVLVLGTVLPFVSGRFHSGFTGAIGGTLKFYEVAYLGLAAFWWIYLMGALFFYYADAFSADRRSNAMLFWKSMPQTDFKILASKMTAGLTLFPALVFGVILFAGAWAYVMTLLADMALPAFAAPALSQVVPAFIQITVIVAAYIALALLWYAPFFAWVGGLSTLAGDGASRSPSSCLASWCCLRTPSSQVPAPEAVTFSPSSGRAANSEADAMCSRISFSPTNR